MKEMIRLKKSFVRVEFVHAPCKPIHRNAAKYL